MTNNLYKIKLDRKIFCNISESEKEIWSDMYTPDVKQSYIGIPFIEFDLIETHLLYPQRENDVTIYTQVSGAFDDLLYQKENETTYINEIDMKFWFNEPDGGWRQGIARYYFLEEIPMQNINWPKSAKIFDGKIRKTIEEFEEGYYVEGHCEYLELNHGICIDFGCSTLGLLLMKASSWEKIYLDVEIENYLELSPNSHSTNSDGKSTIFKCTIRRKLDETHFRWPFELDVHEPSWLHNYIVPLCEYEPLLLVMPLEIADTTTYKYARLCGRSITPHRSYSYHYTEYSENNQWLSSIIDILAGEHSQDYMHNENIHYTLESMKQCKMISKALKSGNLLDI